MRSEDPGAVVRGALPRLEPLRYVRTDALEVAYYEDSPSDGEVALLLHGFSYDIHSYVDVIPSALLITAIKQRKPRVARARATSQATMLSPEKEVQR